MSAQGREPALLRDFRELYEYVYEVGRHVNLIYKRMESIESQLKEDSEKFDEATKANRRDIADIQEKMLDKSEFEEFVAALKAEVEEKLPSLPESTSIKSETSEQSWTSEDED